LSDTTGGMLHRTMQPFLAYGLSIRIGRLNINMISHGGDAY